jgi:hypothetical protein
MTRFTGGALRVVLTTALACAAVGVASAHHSFAPFDLTSEKTVSGVVKQVDWTNPHIWIWLEVANASGEAETWGFEGMSPNFLARRGWTRTTLQAGAKITVAFRPLKDGKPGGMFVSAKLPDGTLLTSGGATTTQ